MADSLLGSLLNTLDKGTISEVAGALGTTDQAVSRGAEASMASILGGMASQSKDPSLLRKILDMVPGGSDISWSSIISGLAAGSPLIASGKKILSGLFGTGENTVINAVSSESGLGTGTASTLLAMAAPMVMSFLNRRVRDEGMTMTALGNLLQRESNTIRNALPAGVSDLFWPRAAAAGTTTTGSPVIAQGVKTEHRSASWLPALALALLALGVFWVDVQFPAILGWDLELHPPLVSMFLMASVTLLLCLAGSFFPALRASRLAVPAALRDE